jgi:hypothetical protein
MRAQQQVAVALRAQSPHHRGSHQSAVACDKYPRIFIHGHGGYS